MSSHPEQVIAVLAHGVYWGLRGIHIAMVEPTSDGGVRVGVRGDPHSAEVALRAYYPFPILCYSWDDPSFRNRATA